MAKIKIETAVYEQLNELVDILHRKGYFGFMADAEKYVEDIYNFIYTIPLQHRKQTFNPKYGAYYCQYKPNKTTTYYIVFDVEGDKYLITNIITNHTVDYPRFIKSS